MSLDVDEFGPEDYGDSGSRTPNLRVVGAAAEWTAGLSTDAKGRLLPTVGNAAIVLQRCPEWSELRYDEFRGEPTLGKAPSVTGLDPPRAGALDDYSIAYISQWLNLPPWGVKVGPLATAAAAVVASKGKGRAVHPVREYLRALKWDGVARVESWLRTYAGAKESPYVDAVGRMWMIAAVARVMQRVSICKTMLILEGPQDAGKSTLLRRLCPVPDWFSDTPVDLGGGKDQYQALRGKWIVEIPELDGFKGKDATRIKSFVSSPVDNYRKSYGKTNEDVPRQCIFAGTTNEEHYFHDSTGNVRFWPVRVGAVDFSRIERERDQLWAEAVAMYTDGAQWHISDSKLSNLAKKEQEEREEEDIWGSRLNEWLRSPLGSSDASSGVTTSTVLTDAIGMPAKDQGRSEQTRIGVLMRKFGFVRVVGSDRPRRYRIETEATEVAPPSGGDFGPDRYEEAV